MEKVSLNPILERLKARIRFWQGWKGHRITELAKYCQVSRGTIYNWIWGKTRPNQAKLMLIKEWLERAEKDVSKESA